MATNDSSSVAPARVRESVGGGAVGVERTTGVEGPQPIVLGDEALKQLVELGITDDAEIARPVTSRPKLVELVDGITLDEAERAINVCVRLGLLESPGVWLIHSGVVVDASARLDLSAVKPQPPSGGSGGSPSADGSV